MTVNVKYWAPRVSNTVIIHHLNHLDQWYTFSEQVYKHLPKHSCHQNLFLRILHSRIPLIHPSYTMSELFNHKLFAFLFFSTHLVQKFQLKCSANNLKRFYGLNADGDLEIQVKTESNCTIYSNCSCPRAGSKSFFLCTRCTQRVHRLLLCSMVPSCVRKRCQVGLYETEFHILSLYQHENLW